MSIDSERDLFRKLPFNLSSRIERSVYNGRKRNLFAYRDSLRKKIAAKIALIPFKFENKNIFDIDLEDTH